MMTIRKFSFIFLLLGLFATAQADPLIKISDDTALRIGIKIWGNECNGSMAGLTSWNEGEGFASLGIGHFNWFPCHGSGPSNDAFPQLIKYMRQRGISVPSWLQGEFVPPCPWHNRREFLAAQNTERMIELRKFLGDSIPIQAEFMVDRLVRALPKLLAVTPSNERDFVYYQLSELSQTPKGIYALVDYVNFKGEGSGSSFAQKNGGWGLLQVIQEMRSAPMDFSALQAFVWSANNVLTRRATQASPYGHEQKWLPGWRKRLYTYLE